MNNIPKVSIIIATYNSANDIEGALNSVLNQTLQDWECIVIDGASKDDTVAKVNKYEEKDSRIEIYSEPDKGIYDAFNKGWKKAKGEWIYYLGSDDRLKPEGLSKILKGATDDSDVVYGGVETIFPDGSIVKSRVFPLKHIRIHMMVCHQAILMRRCVIEKLGGFRTEYKRKADFDIVQRSYLAGYKFKYVDVRIAVFSYTGVTSDFSVKEDMERLRINKKNKSNAWPWFFFWIYEIRVLLWHYRNKYIRGYLKK